MWCPYTNQELEPSQTTPEHIIPLSLGGCNAFTVPVLASINSELGTSIDGKLAKDSLMAWARREADARGHSNHQPEVRFRKAEFNGRPAQVTFPGKGAAPVIWDAKSGKDVPEADIVGKDFKVTFSIERFLRFRFTAKVALSAGYFAYGDLFRTKVEHAEARQLMLTENWNILKPQATTMRIRFDDSFSIRGERPPGDPALALKAAVETGNDSMVILMPTTETLAVAVGVLGQFVGLVTLPADTAKFPISDEQDLGISLKIEGTKLVRTSVRTLMEKLMERLESKGSGGAPLPSPSSPPS